MDSTGRVKFTYTWGTNKDIWHDYTLRGNGPESHQILFCYVGCQYVGVTGAVPQGSPNPDGLPVIRTMSLVHVRAASPVVGSFSCSSELQNGAHRLIDWSIRSNLSYVETDCPHREKNGWQEETWHMARAISYGYDVRSLYRKIARDIRDEQLPDGHIPTNVPNYLVALPPHSFWNEAPEWGISGVLVPWHLFEWYGDTTALVAAYESMKRYVDYLSSQVKDGVITSNLGDWCDYGHGKPPGNSQWTLNEVSATAIWAIGASTVARAAVVLDRPTDMVAYRALFEKIKKDFQRRFYDPVTKTVRNNGSCQASHSMALCAGLIPDRDRKDVLRGIVDELEKRNWQQTVGEVAQVFFVRALAEGGFNAALHRVYAREERGGYGFMVRQGLTTLPESWDATPGTVMSMNHFMLGHLMEWHYAYVAGIRQQSGTAGWRRALIAPDPGPLTSARASFDSPAGRYAVEWKRTGKVFAMTVTVPRGAVAEGVLPDGTHHRLLPGVTTVKGTYDPESMHSPR
jgi:alpha-L-rhamnosidase